MDRTVKLMRCSVTDHGDLHDIEVTFSPESPVRSLIESLLGSLRHTGRRRYREPHDAAMDLKYQLRLLIQPHRGRTQPTVASIRPVPTLTAPNTKSSLARL